ncbi:MAG: transcriptional regulator, partial [Mesorhizobium sp.]
MDGPTEHGVTTVFDELLDRFHAYLRTVDSALVSDAVARIDWGMPVRPLQPRRLACLRHLDRIAELAPPDIRPLTRFVAEHRGDLRWGQTYSVSD